ncbi:L-type lectin-domain containing receptor kinase S.1 [Typha latifolia]|uniref:L-type lectin-domain containing receptor kinase S.1 n=1 Tax=Typha latifolia TaxID=4733 RepID=UPI003C2D0AD2
MPQFTLVAIFVSLLSLSSSSSSAVDFLFNSFNSSDLLLVGDAGIGSSILRLTNSSNYDSFGRAFFPTRLPILSSSSIPNSSLSSFSTSFVFSILPDIPSSPGFGLAFVLSNTTSPPGAISGQYFGLFSNDTHQVPGPLLAVEFDTGQNPEFNDPDGNHVGIDLNFIISTVTHTAGYYRAPANGSASSELEFVTIDMRSGKNVRAWIEFDGPRFQINVTIAPAEEPKPPRPLISYTDPVIANYVSPEMFVGFSGSMVKWVEHQRILDWSLSNTGSPARELNTSNLPLFLPPVTPSSSIPPIGLIVGVSGGSLVLLLLCFLGLYCYCRRKKRAKILEERREEEDEEDEEEWELKYWPRRFSYQDLSRATDGFSRERLLGFGGFGKVYRGVLPISISKGIEGNENGEEEEEVAVKCVSHDSRQGLKEFMAEISSMGRLQHRSLVPMRGWCRRNNELMLVYDYMPNGSLNHWLFPSRDKAAKPMDWAVRRRVLSDVAEGLLYLHTGWEQVVLHRDIKTSNILLDKEMRGRLGDFGLAKLYERGAAPSSTRVVGTLGYLAPELAVRAATTAASDVYSFGVVTLEVVSGRRPIEAAETVEEEDWLLVEWVRGLYAEGRLIEAKDARVEYGAEAEEEVELILKLGLACCHPEPERRPEMNEVVALLVEATRSPVNL